MFKPFQYRLLVLGLVAFLPLLACAQLNPKFLVRFSQAPKDYQVYQRDQKDRCDVTIKGKYSGSEQLWLVRQSRYKYANSYFQVTRQPVPILPDSTFEINTRIGAELREWNFLLFAGDRQIMAFENVVCGDVYAVLGQSNGTSDLGGPEESYAMNGKIFNEDYDDRYSRAFGQGIWGLEANKERYEWSEWGSSSSIYYDQHHSGGWPMKLQYDLIKEQQIPIGIINASLSGSSIEEHFRDAEPLSVLKNPDGSTIHKNPMDYNAFQYFMSKLERGGARNSLKYIFWYQGESDAASSNCNSYYYSSLSTLLDDWNKSLPNLEHIFLFQLNTSCTGDAEASSYKVREAQRIFCENQLNIHLVPTSGIIVDHMANNEVNRNSSFNRPCHYNRSGMEFIANRLLPIINRLIYNNLDIFDSQVFPNKVISASQNEFLDELTLEFLYPISINTVEDAQGSALLKDYFFDESYDPILTQSLEINSNSLRIILSKPTFLQKVSILPPTYYFQGQRTYYGPWLETVGSTLGLPFFADIDITHVSETDQPRFKAKWQDQSESSMPSWYAPSQHKLAIGKFLNSNKDQVLTIGTDSSCTIWGFNSSNWTELAKVKAELDFEKIQTSWVGDFNGDGLDELAILNGDLSIYKFTINKGLERIWKLDSLNMSFDPKNVDLLDGDFDGDGISDLLLFDIVEGSSAIFRFQAEQQNLLKHNYTPLENPMGLSLKYKSQFYPGDFDGDGKDDVLTLGQGAGMLYLEDDNWELQWQSNIFDDDIPWAYPEQLSNHSFLVGELDSNHLGKELLWMEDRHGSRRIKVHGYDPNTKSWSLQQTIEAQDPSTGDWPFFTELAESSWHYLFSPSQGIDHLMTIKEFNCGDSLSSSAYLYELDLNLSTSPDRKSSSGHSKFNLFPNPTQGHLHIEHPSVIRSSLNLSIYDLKGHKVMEHSEDMFPSNFEMDLSMLTPGLYLIRIENAGQNESHKLTITN